MLMFKKGQIGSGLTLFWATIVILGILLVFSFLSIVLKPVVNDSYDRVSVEKLNLDDYMADYRQTISGLSVIIGAGGGNEDSSVFEPMVSLRYFPTRGMHNYDGVLMEGEEKTKEYIYDVCPGYMAGSVVFITGLFDDEAQDLWSEYTDSQVEMYAPDACLKQWEYVKERDESIYGNYEFIYSRVEGTGGDVCCYGS